MDKEKWIKQIIGEAVKEHGFEKFIHSVDGWTHGYEFVRENGDLRQDISITVIDNSIRLEFITNAYGQDHVEVLDMIKSDFVDNGLGFLIFENEEELKEILYLFRDLILQKGFDILEEISKPTTDVRPREETSWKVFSENKELEEKYRKMYGLEDTEFTRKMMQKISDIILEKKDQNFAEVEEMLVGLAAVYGNQIIRKCGGEWRWNDKTKACTIKKIHGKNSTNPLHDLIWYWDRKEEDINCLLSVFRRLPYDTVI